MWYDHPRTSINARIATGTSTSAARMRKRDGRSEMWYGSTGNTNDVGRLVSVQVNRSAILLGDGAASGRGSKYEFACSIVVGRSPNEFARAVGVADWAGVNEVVPR